MCVAPRSEPDSNMRSSPSALMSMSMLSSSMPPIDVGCRFTPTFTFSASGLLPTADNSVTARLHLMTSVVPAGRNAPVGENITTCTPSAVLRDCIVKSAELRSSLICELDTPANLMSSAAMSSIDCSCTVRPSTRRLLSYGTSMAAALRAAPDILSPVSSRMMFTVHTMSCTFIRGVVSSSLKVLAAETFMSPLAGVLNI